MIKFRQKEFIAPLVAGAGRLVAGALPEMAVSGAIGVAGNKMQAKANEEQKEIMEQQAREQKRQNEKMAKAMNKIAENSKNNPQAAQQAASQLNQVMMSQREFARINLGGISKTLKNSRFLKNAGEFGKDLGTIAKENSGTLISGTLAGGVLAGSSYITDKAIQYDMKKNGIPVQKNYANVAGSIMSGLRKAGKATWNAAKNHKGMMIGMAVLGSAPTALGYMAEKQQLKDQIASTKQKTYSLKMKTAGNIFKGVEDSLGNRWNKTKTWWRAVPIGERILGGLSSFAGGGGREGVSNFGKRLQELGEKSGSTWSKKAGKFIVDHPKTALAGSIPVGTAIMTGTWDMGEKLVRKGAKAVDKNAYAYQESKEEQIPQQ